MDHVTSGLLKINTLLTTLYQGENRSLLPACWPNHCILRPVHVFTKAAFNLPPEIPTLWELVAPSTTSIAADAQSHSTVVFWSITVSLKETTTLDSSSPGRMAAMIAGWRLEICVQTPTRGNSPAYAGRSHNLLRIGIVPSPVVQSYSDTCRRNHA